MRQLLCTTGRSAGHCLHHRLASLPSSGAAGDCLVLAAAEFCFSIPQTKACCGGACRGRPGPASMQRHGEQCRWLIRNLILVKAIVMPSSSNYQHSRKFTGCVSIICFIGYSWPQQKALGGSIVESKVQAAKNFSVFKFPGKRLQT